MVIIQMFIQILCPITFISGRNVSTNSISGIIILQYIFAKTQYNRHTIIRTARICIFYCNVIIIENYYQTP